MLAILIGSLALLVGLALLLEPLLLPELSRPRDALWAAVVLLLGLVLVTAAERLQGAPMLGVLCGGLLVGRLGTEVGQQRWQQLPPDERLQLRTVAHWQRRALDLAVAVSRAVGLAGAL
ncbi:MAG: Ycf66 family protein, partial [Cyanobacteriota bacterium]|nr:Ycf66 family protein [Cyanobacteriota bacterium]